VLANLSHLPEKTVLLIENSLKHNSEALVYEKDITVESSIESACSVVVPSGEKLGFGEFLEKLLPEKGIRWSKGGIIRENYFTWGPKFGIFHWGLNRKDFSPSKFGGGSNLTSWGIFSGWGQRNVIPGKLVGDWVFQNPKRGFSGKRAIWGGKKIRGNMGKGGGKSV